MICHSRNSWKSTEVIGPDQMKDSVLNLADHSLCRSYPDFVCRMDLDLDIAVVDLVQVGVAQETFVDIDQVRSLEVHSSAARCLEYKVGWEAGIEDLVVNSFAVEGSLV